ELSSDSIAEKKTTLVILTSEKNKMEGTINSKLGYYESTKNRAVIRKKGEKAFFESIQTGFGSDYEVSNTRIDSLKNLNESIEINYKVSYKQDQEDIIYL